MGGRGPVGGSDGGGLLCGNRVAAADLGEHGDFASEFEGFVDTAGPTDAEDNQPVADARRDGLFIRLLGETLAGVPGM